MKVLFNQTTQINSYRPINARKNTLTRISDLKGFSNINSDIVDFSYVSFGAKGMNPDMKFLLSQACNLNCAYSGRPMLMREETDIIYKKLARRTKAQDAINLLQHLKEYMHPVEKEVFELFCEAPHKKKCNFHDILQNYYDYSLKELKLKQFNILNRANKTIKTLSPSVKSQVLAARAEAMTNIGDAKLARACLHRLKKIKAEGRDLSGVLTIFHTWYELPCPSKDIDAFIVKYAPQSHEAIAKRLISSSVATVEHVQPSTRNGVDGLSNYILVSAQFNNSRSSMPLWEYMMLNPDVDIKGNLQKYMDEVIALVHDKNSPFSRRGSYPEKIRKTILMETKSAVDLNTDRLYLTKKQKKDATYADKLYTVYKKAGKQ